MKIKRDICRVQAPGFLVIGVRCCRRWRGHYGDHRWWAVRGEFLDWASVEPIRVTEPKVLAKV